MDSTKISPRVRAMLPSLRISKRASPVRVIRHPLSSVIKAGIVATGGIGIIGGEENCQIENPIVRQAATSAAGLRHEIFRGAGTL